MVKRVAIRVDASARIGTGHVRRYLSLADSLRRADVGVERGTPASCDLTKSPGD